MRLRKRKAERPLPAFNGERAFRLLEKQCGFGPRAPGTEGHRDCLNFIRSELASAGVDVELQHFTFPSRRLPGTTFRGTNVVARIGPPGRWRNWFTRRRTRALICAHWDTRARADEEDDPARWEEPVPGANDGASGTAVVLELAHVLAETAPPRGVDLVLFDLEDQGDAGYYADHQRADPFCLGSAHYAARMKNIPAFGVLVDMVGASDMRIEMEGYSIKHAPDLTRRLFDHAEKVGATSFVPVTGDEVVDDHVPFLKRGIPFVDVIDCRYPYWHTLSDTPDKCCAASLQAVGDTILALLFDKDAAKKLAE